MGLDMYLQASQYVGGWDHSAPEEQQRFKSLTHDFGVEDFVADTTPAAVVTFTVAYWRKANAIHKWFVDNVQEGVDNCGRYYVPREALTTLRDLCDKALNDPQQAPELLPAQEGFFFGSTDYDQWYFEDLRSTIKQIDRVLAAPEDWEFEYQSSW